MLALLPPSTHPHDYECMPRVSTHRWATGTPQYASNSAFETVFSICRPWWVCFCSSVSFSFPAHLSNVPAVTWAFMDFLDCTPLGLYIWFTSWSFFIEDSTDYSFIYSKSISSDSLASHLSIHLFRTYLILKPLWLYTQTTVFVLLWVCPPAYLPSQAYLRSNLFWTHTSVKR